MRRTKIESYIGNDCLSNKTQYFTLEEIVVDKKTNCNHLMCVNNIAELSV